MERFGYLLGRVAAMAVASSPPSATAIPDTLASPPSMEPSPGFEWSANRPSRSRSSAFTACHIDPIASTSPWTMTSVPLTRGAPSRRSVRARGASSRRTGSRPAAANAGSARSTSPHPTQLGTAGTGSRRFERPRCTRVDVHGSIFATRRDSPLTRAGEKQHHVFPMALVEWFPRHIPLHPRRSGGTNPARPRPAARTTPRRPPDRAWLHLTTPNTRGHDRHRRAGDRDRADRSVIDDLSLRVHSR